MRSFAKGAACAAVCVLSVLSARADAAAEFKGWPRRELKAGGVLDAFDNPMFEKPDIPGVKAGDPTRARLAGGGYNGSAGLRLTLPPSGQRVIHEFPCKVKTLKPGTKYIFSVDVRVTGKAHCHVYWDSRGGANWFPKRTNRVGGWVTEEIAACVPEGKCGDDPHFCTILTPLEGCKPGETFIDYDNLELRVDLPEWHVANTWPIHNQVYNDSGRIRLYTDFVGDFVPKGDETVYLCELVAGGPLGERPLPDGRQKLGTVVVKDNDGVLVADFGPFAYAGAATLKVSLMDRTARQCLGVKEIALEVVKTPVEKPDVVYVDEIGRLRLNGKPWMPIGFYTYIGSNTHYTNDAHRLQRLQEMRASGFDLITDYASEGFDRRGDELYDMIYTNGFRMIYNLTSVYHHRTNDVKIAEYYKTAQEAAKHRPVIGFYVFDELPPSYAPFYDRFRRGLYKAAPDEITWYSNIAAPAPWLVAGDIQGNGSYPVSRADQPDMQLTHDDVNIARAAKCRAAAWLSYGQCFNWANYTPYEHDRVQYLAKGREPTVENMLASVLIFATYGSRAFQFFIFEGMWRGPVPELYEKRWKDMQEVGRTLRSLEPWILSAKPRVEVPHADVKGKTRIVKFTAEDGRECVIAVGLDKVENVAEFEFKGQKKVFRKGPVSCEIYR